MKKFFVIIFAMALLMASCSTVERDDYVVDNHITFQTANAPTKVSGRVFPFDETFSVYAWTKASILPDFLFMDNVTVKYDEEKSTWVPQGNPYYWPRNATVDFLAYYPTGFEGLSVTADKLTYTGVDVQTLQRDLMYSEKAVGYTSTVTEVEDGISSVEGVPIVFHHSLSKVMIVAELAYNHKVADDGTVTDWEVSINSVKVDSIFTSGSAEFVLADTPDRGLVSWVKPSGNVWTHDDAVMSVSGSVSGDIIPGNTYTVIDAFYVLPQALTAGHDQKLTINLTVKTIRNGSEVLSETFNRSAYLHSNALPAWEINHAYTYRLLLCPASSNGNGGSATDPDLSDAIITFAPSVGGWQGIGVETSIEF